MNYIVSFSPTGKSFNAMRKLGELLGRDFKEIDLCSLKEREKKTEFKSDDFVIIGSPVYGGRIPPVEGLFLNIFGENTPCVVCSCFGNRDYDDALLELKNKVELQGFKCIGACALVIPHVYSKVLGKDRPDEKDIEEMKGFAEKINEKLRTGDLSEITVKGNFPYKEWKMNGNVPVPDENCIKCGKCAAVCPVGAISNTDFRADEKLCIRCTKCLYICPVSCRKMDFSAVTKRLEENFSRRKDNEYFI